MGRGTRRTSAASDVLVGDRPGGGVWGSVVGVEDGLRVEAWSASAALRASRTGSVRMWSATAQPANLREQQSITLASQVQVVAIGEREMRDVTDVLTVRNRSGVLASAGLGDVV
jgi:hypothetical protein